MVIQRLALQSLPLLESHAAELSCTYTASQLQGVESLESGTLTLWSEALGIVHGGARPPCGMLIPTHGMRRHLPLAKDLVRLSRQQLVHRLDSYTAKRNMPAFLEVVKIIDSQVIPLLRKCSLAGHAEFKTQNPVSAAVPQAHSKKILKPWNLHKLFRPTCPLHLPIRCPVTGECLSPNPGSRSPDP